MLSAFKKQGLNQSQIARALGRDKGTISREVRRNSKPYDGAYRPSVANYRASGRRSRSRRNQQFTADDYAVVESYLEQAWSPEQIAGRLRLEDTLSISHETIYRHIWEDKDNGGELWRNLRCARKLRRKRRNTYDSRGRLAGKRDISERPASVEGRRTIGHWEGDTVFGTGPKDCVLTMNERKSGFAVIGKLKDRTKNEINARARKLMGRHPEQFKTLTLDNGCEFHGYAELEEKTGVTCFFAKPYHSWERGSNENFNGLVRQFLPKGASMADLTQHQCNAIAHQLNTRPRKRLAYRTPEEVFLPRNSTRTFQPLRK